MIDGIFTPEEWDDAAAIRTGDGTTFLAKQEKGHLFIGIRRDSTMFGWAVNLFIQPAGREIHQLHTSAQIGEIILAGPGEDDPPFRWGYSPGWTANEARWDQARAQELVEGGLDLVQAQIRASYPMHGYEFQIQKSRFKTSSWRVRFEVVSQAGRAPYPPNTERKDTTGWLTLHLDGGAGQR